MTYTTELLFVEAMDNEALDIKREFIGTEEGQRLCRQRVLANCNIYAEMFGVDIEKFKAYCEERQF